MSASWKKLLPLLEAQKYRFPKKAMSEIAISLKPFYNIDDSISDDEAYLYVSKKRHQIIEKEIVEVNKILDSANLDDVELKNKDFKTKLAELGVFLTVLDLGIKFTSISKVSMEEGMTKTLEDQFKKFDFPKKHEFDDLLKKAYYVESSNMIVEQLIQELELEIGINNGKNGAVKNDKDVGEKGVGKNGKDGGDGDGKNVKNGVGKNDKDGGERHGKNGDGKNGKDVNCKNGKDGVDKDRKDGNGKSEKDEAVKNRNGKNGKNDNDEGDKNGNSKNGKNGCEKDGKDVGDENGELENEDDIMQKMWKIVAKIFWGDEE